MQSMSRSIQKKLSRNPEENSLKVIPKLELANMNESGSKSKNNDQNDINNHIVEEANDLSTIFDKCGSIMIQLLGFSLTRFKSKPEWQKVLMHSARK